LIIAFLTKMMFRPFAILSVIFLGSILPLTQDWNPYWYSASQNISNGEYRDFINVKSSILNAGVHRVIQKFDDLVKNEIPYNDYFWIMYPNSPNWLLSVDASVLYGYSCFNCQQNNGLTKARNFPSVSPAEIAILKQRQYVILFSDSVTSTKKAIDTLLLNQPKWKLQSQHNFASDDLELSVGIIKVAR
jgi:hypothetical protein